MSKTLVALALLSAVLVGSSILLTLQTKSVSQEVQIDARVQSLWKQWKTTYHKRFADPEVNDYRLAVFADNLEFVEADHSGTMGITQFFDLTPEEFAATYLTETSTLKASEPVAKDVNVSTSIAINWNTAGKVTAVKNQGSCGACWTFSATGAIESALIIAGKATTSVDLSEQQLVDCDTSSGNNGCSGGNKSLAFTYVQKNGLTTEANYPYLATQGTCNSKKILSPITKIQSQKQVSASTQSLVEALAITPIAISVDATYWSYYTGGVFSNCKTNTHNHAVLLTGIQDGNWIVKNSWGPKWGENGYIRLKNGNTCGLANIPFYPVV